MKTFKLSEFTAFLRRVLALNFSDPVWITAELGQVNSSRGHTYLSLIEKSEDGSEHLLAQLDAVIWASKAMELNRKHGLGIQQIFREGMQVRLRVIADFHDRYGFKLLVQDADPQHTLGLLALQRQAAHQQLQREGLLGKNSQQPLSLVPQRLAIISSEAAAGYADFCQQLSDNPYAYRFSQQLFRAAVQGSQSVVEITNALQKIARQAGDFDAVCIVRGGGAKMDLLAFDELSLCREVAHFPLPVLVGVGHETDDVLLDSVAWKSLKTPTAVAAFLLDRTAHFEAHLSQIGHHILQVGQYKLLAEQQRLLLGQRQLPIAGKHLLQLAKRALEEQQAQLSVGSKRCIQQAWQNIEQKSTLLHALRPETSLARGFALLSQGGKLIRQTTELDHEQALSIRLQDGEVDYGPSKPIR